MSIDDLLDRIKELVGDRCYRVKIHTVRHMVEEGFSERNMVDAILGDSKIIELYDEDKRCLILGQFPWNGRVKSPLHIICDYSNKKIIDVVTAYIPQEPWWVSPTQRRRK